MIPKDKSDSISKNLKLSNTIYKSQPKVFGIGRSIPPKRDLSRFVRWPKYVRIQRQRRIIYERLKVPPTISQFSKTLDKNQSKILYKLLFKYHIEDMPCSTPKKAKVRNETLMLKSKAKLNRKTPSTVIKYGINNITKLIETKRAQMIVIAHDVDPIEIFCWLPTLCQKMGVPYVIVKSKANLGRFVDKKTCTAIAITGVAAEDARDLFNLVDISDRICSRVRG